MNYGSSPTERWKKDHKPRKSLRLQREGEIVGVNASSVTRGCTSGRFRWMDYLKGKSGVACISKKRRKGERGERERLRDAVLYDNQQTDLINEGSTAPSGEGKYKTRNPTDLLVKKRVKGGDWEKGTEGVGTKRVPWVLLGILEATRDKQI